MTTSITSPVRSGDGRTDEECHRERNLAATELGCECRERRPRAEHSTGFHGAHHGLRSDERDGVYDEQRSDVSRGAKRMTSQIRRGTRDREASVDLGGVSGNERGSRPHANVRGRIRPGGARSG
jgi:hypothetical protein